MNQAVTPSRFVGTDHIAECWVVYDYCNLGGVTSAFKQRIRYLRQRGVETRFKFLFRMDVGGRDELAALSGVTVDICPTADFVKWVTTIVEKSDDCIILVDQPNLVAPLTKTDRRLFYEVHTSMDNYFRAMRLIDFSGVDAIICVSEWLRRKIIEAVPRINADSVVVCHNFVDPELFGPIDALTERTNFGAQPVVWVGKISPEKNWSDYFRVLDLIFQQSLRATPVMLAGGMASPSNFLALLHAIDRRGLNSDVRLICNVAHAHIPKVMNTIRRAGGVFLSTSKFESFGLAALEALSCGVPVIAARVGGLGEVLKGMEECLFELGDNARAARLVSELLRDTQHYAEASRRSVERAAAFDRESIMDRYWQLIENAGAAARRMPMGMA